MQLPGASAEVWQGVEPGLACLRERPKPSPGRRCVASGCSRVPGDRARGGGMASYGCHPTVTNCSFIGNHASVSGGGISGEGTVTNTILWNNLVVPSLGPKTPNQIEVVGHLIIGNSDVQGGQSSVVVSYGTLTWNCGNIDADPLKYFVLKAKELVLHHCLVFQHCHADYLQVGMERAPPLFPRFRESRLAVPWYPRSRPTLLGPG